MIGYAILGTNDKGRAVAFYDDLLGLLGARQVMTTDRLVFWGNGRGKPMLAVGSSYNGEPAATGNGNMVALAAPDKETVDTFYAKALELGGRSEGEPGKRTDNFYGAYFRDPDGNKLAVFCMV